MTTGPHRPLVAAGLRPDGTGGEPNGRRGGDVGHGRLTMREPRPRPQGSGKKLPRPLHPGLSWAPAVTIEATPLQAVENLLKELMGARKAFRLYPASNPLAAEWLQRLYRAADAALGQGPLRLRVTQTGAYTDIGEYELWTFDLQNYKLLSRSPFRGRPRMSLRASSSGQLLYIYQAGHTIDVYEAATFRHLRTIELDGDMTRLVLMPPPRR